MCTINAEIKKTPPPKKKKKYTVKCPARVWQCSIVLPSHSNLILILFHANESDLVPFSLHVSCNSNVNLVLLANIPNTTLIEKNNFIVQNKTIYI